MEPKFNLIEDGEFSQMYTDFISSDALSLSQLLTIPTQDLVAENKGNYHKFSIEFNIENRLYTKMLRLHLFNYHHH